MCVGLKIKRKRNSNWTKNTEINSCHVTKYAQIQNNFSVEYKSIFCMVDLQKKKLRFTEGEMLRSFIIPRNYYLKIARSEIRLYIVCVCSFNSE